jgi:hypothetical protein
MRKSWLADPRGWCPPSLESNGKRRMVRAGVMVGYDGSRAGRVRWHRERVGGTTGGGESWVGQV